MKINNYYQTSDMTTITTMHYLGFPICGMEKIKKTHRIVFSFRHSLEFDKTLDAFNRLELRVEPVRYFESMKTIRARLESMKCN